MKKRTNYEEAAQRQYMGCKSQRGKGLGDIQTGSYGVHKIDKATRRSGIINRGLGRDAGALIFDIVFDMVLSHKKSLLIWGMRLQAQARSAIM